MGCLLFPDISLKLKDVGWCRMPLSYKKTVEDEAKTVSLKLIVITDNRLRDSIDGARNINGQAQFLQNLSGAE
jgi:hypothetical protein